MLSAYRIGARVAWENMSATAVACEVDTAELVSLAEAIFVYIDELSAASAQGHSSQAGLRDVLRSRLAQALLDGRPSPTQSVCRRPPTPRAGCCPSGWPWPWSRSRPDANPPPQDVLALVEGQEALAILPDPSGPGRRQALERAWEGSQVFVGTVRPPAEAPISLAHARRVQRLVAQGRVPDTRVVAAADHLAELVAAADSELLAELASRVTAPLADLKPAKREALEQTLSAWLAFQGDRQRIAEYLHVHPQTVSYRHQRARALRGRIAGSARATGPTTGARAATDDVIPRAGGSCCAGVGDRHTRWRSSTDVGDPRRVQLQRMCVYPTCVHNSNACAGRESRGTAPGHNSNAPRGHNSTPAPTQESSAQCRKSPPTPANTAPAAACPTTGTPQLDRQAPIRPTN